MKSLSPRPVSYTHLDVYKRQAIPGATSDTLRVTSSAQVSGNRYYCVVQDQVGQKIVSAEACLLYTSHLLVPQLERF